MFKLKLTRCSSSSSSPRTYSRHPKPSGLVQEHFKRLKAKLARKQNQLELLQEQAAQTIQTVRAEEHERLVFALASLRRRLLREKATDLRQQRQTLTTQFEDELNKVREGREEHQYNSLASWIKCGTNEEEEKEQDSSVQSMGDDVKENVHSLSDSRIHEFDEEDEMKDIRSSTEKHLEDDALLAISSFKIPRSNVWSCRDKFRRHSPLDASRSIMTTIEEEKEEYDWFEERRQLLQDNSKLNSKIQELEVMKRKLENELQEVRDQNELLEFRILELEEDPPVLNHRGTRQATVDQGTNTDSKPNRKESSTLQATKKLLYPELWKYNEEKLNAVCEKLNEWADNKRINLPEDVNVLLQATALLDFLKQHIYMVPHTHDNLNLEDKLHFQDTSEKMIVEKLHHTNLSMSSSIDSASDGLDMISQGGETGYGSDESIDTEELYQANVNPGDFSISNNPSSPDKLEFETEASRDFHILSANVLMTSDPQNMASKARICEMLRQIQVMKELPRLQTKQHEQDAKADSLNKDNMPLSNETCLHFEQSDTNTSLSLQNIKIEMSSLIESEKRLRATVAELIEKDNVAVARISNLEQERDKLRLEAKQLLQLIIESNALSSNGQSLSECLQSSPTLQKTCCGQTPERETVNIIVTTREGKAALLETESKYSIDMSSDPNSFHSPCKISDILIPTNELHIQKLLAKNQNLQCSLDAKDIEMQNKKTEYDLKIEALKCDHEETMASLEERLSSMQQRERDLRQRLVETIDVKDKLETQFKTTLEELLLERSKRFQHPHPNQTNDIREKGCYVSTCQVDIYENQDASNLNSKHGICDRANTFAALENHLNQLCHEAEGKTLALANAADDGELHINSDGNLLEKIHDMAREQTRLKQRIFELEKKETAYKETLQEADKIMADVEKGYKERIEELEQLEGKLRARIVQLEQSEKRLRQTLKHNNRNSEVGKFGELLDRLLETEAAEQRLNERIHDLQQKFQQQKEYVTTVEKEKRVLEEELQDQEELLHTINCMKRVEKDMCLRIEELQTSESALQETLHQADAILAEREAKLQDQLRLMEAELQQLRRANDQMNFSEVDLKQLLAEAEELARSSTFHGSIADAGSSEQDVRRQQSFILHNNHTDSSTLVEELNPVRIHRMADIVEMNSQLELQLLQVQSSNGTLRDRVLQLESELLHQDIKLKGPDSSDETNACLKLNLELLAKNSEIERLQDKLKLLETGNTAAELQTLSLHADEIRQLKEKINFMSTNIEICNCCNCANCQPLLDDIASEVLVLDQLVSGSCSPDYSLDETVEVCYQETMNSARSNATNHLNGKEIMEINSCQKTQSNKQSNNSAQKDELNNSKQLQNLQTQVAILQDELVHKRKQLEAKEDEIHSLRDKVEKRENHITLTEIESNNLQNNIRNLQKENADLQQKTRKAELSDKVLHEHLHRKKQDLKISTQQIQQLEHRLSLMEKHLKSSDELTEVNQNLMQKIHELEAEMQKKREVERKLHAENLHLHHKVEAQRERITSLQIVKKDYKNMMSKYDLLEKQKKIVDQAVVPLKNKISHLNQKCKEKDQFITHLTKQKQLMSSNNSKSYKVKSPAHFLNNESVENHEQGQILSSPDLHLSLSSSSDVSDRSSDSLNSHGSGKTLTPSARSRIPRYVALSSPSNSPRSSESKITSCTEVPHEQSPRSQRHLKSPKPKSSPVEASYKKTLNIPSTPTDFQVTRQVGSDSILVAWTPPVVENLSANSAMTITGYQVFVNGVLNQKVRSPNRTKALLTGIDLSQPAEVAIRSVGEPGILSNAAKVVFSASNVTPSPKIDRKIPSKRKSFIKCNYNPPKSTSTNPFMELKLKEGNIATIFGSRQANGFFYGEVNGHRGLIPAHALDDHYDSRNVVSIS